MDLVGGCGTISIVRSWWLAIVAFAFIVMASARAEAQVFKPRGGKKAAPTKKAPAAEKSSDADKPAKKTAARPAKKAPAKKSRAADSGRPSDLTPTASKKKKGRKVEEDEDDVASSDAGDDEVIITDDDD